jgi:hypothetical protein
LAKVSFMVAAVVVAELMVISKRSSVKSAAGKNAATVSLSMRNDTPLMVAPTGTPT